MKNSWSVYIIILVVLNIVGCLWLLWRTSGKRADGKPADSTSHVWDGDLTEYDKPLPRWWINLFYITIVFTIGYLAWYPGFGSFKGFGNWTSQNQHDADKLVADAKLATTLKPYDGVAIDVLARNPEALRLGRSIFAANCVTCHGSAATGAVGYPNLTDTLWQWGGSVDDVTHTVLEGRNAVMPAWRATLESMGGADAPDEVATYVLSLTDKSLLATNAESAARGGKLFAGVCAACHGPAAKGNPALGAPDLTDDYWLYGRSRAIIREGLGKGRNGVMPAHKPLIGETPARLAAAYVWSLSHADQKQ
jgi:cytochrome c oxidase cbb3-type subunit 3